MLVAIVTVIPSVQLFINASRCTGLVNSNAKKSNSSSPSTRNAPRAT